MISPQGLNSKWTLMKVNFLLHWANTRTFAGEMLQERKRQARVFSV